MDEIKEKVLLGRQFYDMENYAAANEIWKEALQSAYENSSFPLMYVLSTNLGDVVSKLSMYPSESSVCFIKQAIEYYDYAEAIAEKCDILHSFHLRESLLEIRKKRNRLMKIKNKNDTLQHIETSSTNSVNKCATKPNPSKQHIYLIEDLLSLREISTEIPKELDPNLSIVSPLC
ncbi:unnamed protein product [Albugo candida]|uniref:Uncharacterized protein n=1 Tax=Albugo candida TaxID=65357 RepID=A0A024GK58_9STRA|nr:unnamed protein product [Albugo candida]|eukprot:CCI47266.1 unnamed protein product [Albugo candida]